MLKYVLALVVIGMTILILTNQSYIKGVSDGVQSRIDYEHGH